MKKNKIFFVSGLSFIALAGGAAIYISHKVPSLVLAREVNHDVSSGAPRKPIHLLFVGDQGTGDDNQRASAAVLEDLCQRHSPEALFLLGDNFYNKGVTGTSDPLWDRAFEEVYSGPCLKRLKFYAILGNHDYKGNSEAQIAYTQVSKSGRWQMPARHYSVHFGDRVSVFATDTNWPDRCGSTFCQMDAVEQSISKSKSKWKVVIGHHPMLSQGKYRTTKAPHRWLFAPLFCRKDVNMYIAGHDHNWQIHSTEVAGCPLHQLIAGIGGGRVYDVLEPDSRTLASGIGYGGVLASFGPESAQYQIYTHGQKSPVHTESIPLPPRSIVTPQYVEPTELETPLDADSDTPVEGSE